MSRLQEVITSVVIAGSALVAASSCSTSETDEVGPLDASEVVITEPQNPENHGRPGSAGTRSAPDNGAANESPLNQTGDDQAEGGQADADPADTDLAAGDPTGGDAEENQTRTPESATVAGITKSISDPNSVWILVNKQNALPVDFEPNDLVEPDIRRVGEHQKLRAEAAAALTQMAHDAKEEVGKTIQLVSGYRSYADQKEIYQDYVVRDGLVNADTYSARPGHSEHQTGLAADLSEVRCKMSKFGDSKAGQWVAENSWKYGFILRYTPANTGIVGYQSEPWHYRYVGPELATYYHDNGISSLEQAFGKPPAPDYGSPDILN